MGKLDEKIALITGGGQGIGEAISIRLAKEGANIIVSDIDLNSATETAEKIKAMGCRSIVIRADVSNNKDVEEMVKSAMDEFGRIDILVNNAGILTLSSVVELEEREWDKVIDINLKGVFLCSKGVAKIMVNQKSGKIVNISSSAAKKPGPFVVHYSAAKAGVVAFTQGLARELGSYNINVNAVCPGVVDTKMWRYQDEKVGKYLGLPKGELTKRFIEAMALHRLQPPEAIAAMVVFLASKEADEVTGQAINICGGYVMH